MKVINKFNIIAIFFVLLFGYAEFQNTNAQGIITTVIGNGTGGLSGDGGAATDASINSPAGVHVDSSGSIFIVDNGNNRIRKVDSSGNITTVAGNGTAAFSGDGGAATNASLNSPFGVYIDGVGNLFIADKLNHRIRKIDTSGIITTVAGNGDFPGTLVFGGLATESGIPFPQAVFVDDIGNMFIALQDDGLVKVDSTGIMTAVASKEDGSIDADVDGKLATGVKLGTISDVIVDSSGNIFIVDSTPGFGRVFKIDTSGIIVTVAGQGSGVMSGDIGDNGPATDALFNQPQGMFLDGTGNIFVADWANSRIRKVDTFGIITTVAGNGEFTFAGDGGLSTDASFFMPRDVYADETGNLYVADQFNHRIRKVNAPLPGPSISTITAADPDNSDTVFSDGDTITVVFAESTNQPAGAIKTEIDNLFTFSQNLGVNYTGAWPNSSSLVITIVDSSGATPPAIGQLTITVKSGGNLTNTAGTSLGSTAISPVLAGNWGTFVATPTLTPTPVVSATPTPVLVETPTPSQTPVLVETPTPTPSPTPVLVETQTPTPTPTPTMIFEETPTPTIVPDLDLFNLLLNDQSGNSGDEVTYIISLNNVPEDLRGLQFSINYDPDVLRFVESEEGELVSSFDQFSAADNNNEGVILVVGVSFGEVISAGTSGSLVKLKFIVNNCENIGLTFTNLLGDSEDYIARDGEFICLAGVSTPTPISEGESKWNVQTIDSSDEVGAFTSIGIDSSNNVHISYFNNTNFNLKYTTNMSGDWRTETADSETGTGMSSSLSIDGSGNVHIIHIDTFREILKYTTNISGVWQSLSTDLFVEIFSSTSIAVDSSGIVNVSYLKPSFIPAFATNFSGEWISEIVADNTDSPGGSISMDIDNSGKPHISYFDPASGDLKYMTKVDDTWQIAAVDSVGDVGLSSSINIDSFDVAHISYWDKTNGSLKYASNVTGTWETTTVDDNSNGDVGLDSSIEVDGSGKVHISYLDVTNKDLKYASNSSGEWRSTTVDAEGDVGFYTSIGLDAFNNVHISYADETNIDLKYATSKIDENETPTGDTTPLPSPTPLVAQIVDELIVDPDKAVNSFSDQLATVTASDENNNPVPGITISARAFNNSTVSPSTAITDANGAASFNFNFNNRRPTGKIIFTSGTRGTSDYKLTFIEQVRSLR